MHAQDPGTPAQRPAVSRQQLPRRRTLRKRRVSVVGVLGELLITAGVLVLLFLGWQLWWNDLIVAGQQRTDAAELSSSWTRAEPTTDPVPTEEPAESTTAEPVVTERASSGDDFAILYVPRFAEYEENYSRVITEGVDHTSILNAGRIGHYPSTQLPGEAGNFVLAGHRSAYGGGMHWITDFQLGDRIYIETADGWYSYVFRDLEFVPETQVDVLAPVPRHEGVEPSDSIVTLTSCNPLWSTAERVIAYGVFDSFQPRSAGAPAEITAAVAAQQEG